jgi:hypothetical protein
MSSEARRLLLGGLVLLAGACADLERGPAAPAADAGSDASGDGGGGGAGFAAARAVLTARCASCHAPGQAAGQTALLFTGDQAADYAAARMFVDLGQPAASRLLSKAAGQGHGGGSILRPESPEYATLLAWTQGGAGP